jgi:hypothetical protein
MTDTPQAPDEAALADREGGHPAAPLDPDATNTLALIALTDAALDLRRAATQPPRPTTLPSRGYTASMYTRCIPQ